MKNSNSFLLGKVKCCLDANAKLASASLSKAKTTLHSISFSSMNQPSEIRDKEVKTVKMLNESMTKSSLSPDETFFSLMKNQTIKQIAKDINTKNIINVANEFEYRQIFGQPLKEKEKLYDNKLNIIYAKNEKELLQRNKNRYPINYLIKSYSIRAGYLNKKLNEINDKMQFMKGITNHVFPNIALKNIHVKTKSLIEKNKEHSQRYISPCDKQYRAIKHNRNEQSNYLGRSIYVLNKSYSLPSIRVK